VGRTVRILVPDGVIAFRERGAGPPVTLCHGFSLAGASWTEVVAATGPGWRWWLPDARGHGATGVPPGASHSLEASADDLLRSWDAAGIGRGHLGGYSMGGRLALTLAVRAPQRLRSLVVVSAHAGLHPSQRAARRAADGDLARRIIEQGIGPFADAWERLPLFAGVARRGPRPRARLARLRRRSRPQGLAASLRDAGAGAMAPLWDRLPTVTCPALIVVGAEDPRYRAHAARLARVLPQARVVVVPRCGHAVPHERPFLLGRLLREFLRQVEAGGG